MPKLSLGNLDNLKVKAQKASEQDVVAKSKKPQSFFKASALQSAIEGTSGILEDDDSLSGGSNNDEEEVRSKKKTPSEKAQSMKSKYFVSNMFVEKIFDTMTCTYKEQMEKLEADIKDHGKNIQLIFDTLTKEIPQV